MKSFFVIFLALACFSSMANAAGKRPAADEVVVKVLDMPLPHEENNRSEFLWDNFANKPEETKFNAYRTKKWNDNFPVFAKTLVQKAAKQKLDSDSLRKVLDLVKADAKDAIAYLPVGAYQTTLDGKLVWIVTVKWEFAYPGKDLELCHIRMFAFDQATLKQVGYCTCG